MAVDWCDVAGGEAGVHVQGGGALAWGSGNLDADPLFKGEAMQDLRLSGGSPCIDSGDPAGPPDADGTPPDMGALTFQPFGDLGYALPGALGAPKLAGHGTCTPGEMVLLELGNAAPQAPATLVLGSGLLLGPFKGGVMVPQPGLLVGPLAVDAGGNSEKCLAYPGDTPIQGAVDRATGTLRLSVPRYLLRALSGGTGHLERPMEVAATLGSRFYDATAWSLGNVVSPVQDAQSFLYPFDSTPAFDFLLTAGGGGGGTSGCKVTGGGSIGETPQDGRFTVNGHANLVGHVAYRDDRHGVDFRSTSLASVACSGAQATVTGSGYDGDRATTFSVTVTDGKGSGSSDSFSISLGSGYNRSGALTRGNLTVHK